MQGGICKFPPARGIPTSASSENSEMNCNREQISGQQSSVSVRIACGMVRRSVRVYTYVYLNKEEGSLIRLRKSDAVRLLREVRQLGVQKVRITVTEWGLILGVADSSEFRGY